MRSILVIIVLLFISCSLIFADEIVTEGPFAGIDLALLPEKDAIILREANEDFLLVANGAKPKYARFNKDAPLPADGGTTFYKGRQYNLTIIQSLSSFGNLHGFIYGPIIEFDKEFAPGNYRRVELLRFYSNNQLRAIKK